MTAKEVQHALTYSQRSPFYIRSHIVVPNVSWGLDFNHELDLLSISMQTNKGTEIEIKVSKSDLKKDLEKQHKHYDSRISQLYFAGPQELEEAFFEFVPKGAGIITVFKDEKAKWYFRRWQCTVRRRATPKKNCREFTKDEMFRLMRLGNMRYWSLFGKQFKNVAEKKAE